MQWEEVTPRETSTSGPVSVLEAGKVIVVVVGVLVTAVRQGARAGAARPNGEARETDVGWPLASTGVVLVVLVRRLPPEEGVPGRVRPAVQVPVRQPRPPGAREGLRQALAEVAGAPVRPRVDDLTAVGRTPEGPPAAGPTERHLLAVARPPTALDVERAPDAGVSVEARPAREDARGRPPFLGLHAPVSETVSLSEVPCETSLHRRHSLLSRIDP